MGVARGSLWISAEIGTQGAWYREWRLVSLDGSCLDIADTGENCATFGRPEASRGESAFPQLRFVALVENGTHVLFGARLGGFADGETTLAHEALPALERAPRGLAVDRHHLVDPRGEGRDEAAEASLEPGRIEQPEQA